MPRHFYTSANDDPSVDICSKLPPMFQDQGGIEPSKLDLNILLSPPHLCFLPSGLSVIIIIVENTSSRLKLFDCVLLLCYSSYGSKAKFT